MRGSDTVVAWVAGNVFSLIGLILFHLLVTDSHGINVANRAGILILLYPGSVYFFVPYSESLCLLLFMFCLYSLRRNFLVGAALASFLLPMSRAVGIFILPILAWELFFKGGGYRRLWICLLPLLGYFCYFLIMYSYTGNPFEGFRMQLAYDAQPSISRIFDVSGFFYSFVHFNFVIDSLHSFLDRLIFVAFLLSLYPMLRLDTTYYVYAVFIGLIPAMSNIFMSYTRFSALVFPVFIVWARLTLRNRMLPVVAMLFYGLQVFFLVLLASGRWVN